MNTDIHRLLDEAFAGVEMTPEAQDLKEEVRANLIARVDELEVPGRSSSEAARLAIAELGDVRELLEGTAAPADGAPARDSYTAMQLRHRVRPKPGFVVRVVVFSLVFVVGMTLAILGATGVIPLPVGLMIGLMGVASGGLAYLVADSLSQETTTNHPMPPNRAAGYYLATFVGTYGLGIAVLLVLGLLPMWCVVFAALGVIGAIILFAFLAASQTNRHKAWVRQAHHDAAHAPNRFEEEPETAARFGIYTAVIWLVTFGVIVVLVFTVGWWWAPLAFLGGFAAMMLLLARMLFAPKKS
jgi:MFS family permease